MKKRKLLSLLTAGAVIATTAGTYAAWDTLKAETTQTVEFRKPVTVAVDTQLTMQKDITELGVTPTATGNASFTIVNENDLAKKLILKPVIESSESITTDDFDFSIIDVGNSNASLTGDAKAGFVDDSLNSLNYTIKVTPKEEDKIKGKVVTLKLTAELSK